LSILDFIEYCHRQHMRIESAHFIGRNKKVRLFPNLFAEIGIFVISGEDNSKLTDSTGRRRND